MKWFPQFVRARWPLLLVILFMAGQSIQKVIENVKLVRRECIGWTEAQTQTETHIRNNNNWFFANSIHFLFGFSRMRWAPLTSQRWRTYATQTNKSSKPTVFVSLTVKQCHDANEKDKISQVVFGLWRWWLQILIFHGETHCDRCLLRLSVRR